MTEFSAERYAHEVGELLTASLRSSGRHSAAGLPQPADVVRMILDTSTDVPANPLAERIGPVWSSVKTRAALGLRSRQALSSRRKSGTILGVSTTDGKVYYPIFQFRRTSAGVEVKPNLVPVLKTLRGVDSWTVAAMLMSPDPDLGMSVVEWERSGREPEPLRDWARRVQRELTAP